MVSERAKIGQGLTSVRKYGILPQDNCTSYFSNLPYISAQRESTLDKSLKLTKSGVHVAQLCLNNLLKFFH